MPSPKPKARRQHQRPAASDSAKASFRSGRCPTPAIRTTHIEVIDKKRFKGSAGTGGVERVATGFRWAEGPAYNAAGRYLIFSDIPNNRMMRLIEDDNHLSVFRHAFVQLQWQHL